MQERKMENQEVINYLLAYNDLKIIQRKDMFNFSLDTVLLASFCTLNKDLHKIIDFGTNNAAIPLLLSRRTDKEIIGIEIQKDAVELAIKNVKLNHLENQITIIHNDIKDYVQTSEKFKLVVCNPPFFKVGERSHINENEYLQIAIEYGIPFLFVVLLVIAFCLWEGSSEGRTGICGGVISVLVFAFSSYPMQIPGFAVTFYFLLAACVIGRSKIMLLLFISMIALLGTYYWKNNQYVVCKDWYRSKMLYNIGAYQSAKEEYEKLYSELKNRGAFLFEYGYCLHKLKEYDSSTKVLKEAMEYSNDPMILNIIGKNYQELHRYEQAEAFFLRSVHRLPGRIYPYYLLANLYAEPEFYRPDKLKKVADVVLTKKPKVHSTAIEEMRKEIKKIVNKLE